MPTATCLPYYFIDGIQSHDINGSPCPYSNLEGEDSAHTKA